MIFIYILLFIEIDVLTKLNKLFLLQFFFKDV